MGRVRALVSSQQQFNDERRECLCKRHHRLICTGLRPWEMRSWVRCQAREESGARNTQLRVWPEKAGAVKWTWGERCSGGVSCFWTRRVVSESPRQLSDRMKSLAIDRRRAAVALRKRRTHTSMPITRSPCAGVPEVASSMKPRCHGLANERFPLSRPPESSFLCRSLVQRPRQSGLACDAILGSALHAHWLHVSISTFVPDACPLTVYPPALLVRPG